MQSKNLMVLLAVGACCNLVSGCNRRERTAAIERRQNAFLADSILIASHFDATLQYHPCSLLYKGKPLFIVGKSISSLDSSLSLHRDQSTLNHNYLAAIDNYFCSDDFYTFPQSSGSLNGSLFLLTDTKNKRLFSVSGSWILDIHTNPKTKSEALQTISSKLFPCLKGKIDFDSKHRFVMENEQFRELFRLSAPDSTNSHWWHLDYEVQLKPQFKATL